MHLRRQPFPHNLLMQLNNRLKIDYFLLIYIALDRFNYPARFDFLFHQIDNLVILNLVIATGDGVAKMTTCLPVCDQQTSKFYALHRTSRDTK